MEEKNYYRQLRKLFEDTAQPAQPAAMNNQLQQPIPEEEPSQEEVPMEDPSMMTQGDPNALPVDGGMEDANYLMDQPAEPVETNDALDETQRKIKLFNLMKNLKTYGENFLDSLQSVEIENLKFEVYKKYLNLLEKLKTFNEKVNTYLTESFKQNKYEKELYVYILFRTELLEIIRELRSLLTENSIEPKD